MGHRRVRAVLHRGAVDVADIELVPNGKADYVYSNFVHGFKRVPVKRA